MPRKTESLFNQIVCWINGEDDVWEISRLISEVSQYYEQITPDKRRNRNPYYRTRTYVCYLKRAGWIKSAGWGKYQRTCPIPDRYTLYDLEIQLGLKQTTTRKLSQFPRKTESLFNQIVSWINGGDDVFTAYEAFYTNPGKIKGVVRDETGAPVEYATVVILQNGVIKGGAHTDENGAYSIAPGSPGTYEVKASFAGNTIVAGGVQVAANKTVMADLEIETGVEMAEVQITETMKDRSPKFNIEDTVLLPAKICSKIITTDASGTRVQYEVELESSRPFDKIVIDEKHLKQC